MRKKRCLCKDIACENRAKGGLAVDYEICQLCDYEFNRLAPHVGEKARLLSADDGNFGLEAAKERIQAADRENSDAVYAFLRGLYWMCLHNHEMDVADAYEHLCTFVPQTAADVFDYSMKERTGGGVYPSLSARIAALMEAAAPEKAAPAENVSTPDEVPF